jgi:hypothetical protein
MIMIIITYVNPCPGKALAWSIHGWHNVTLEPGADVKKPGQ